MKKLFNLKSLLVTIVLVLVFGAVGAVAETDYMTDNAVAVGGNYYIKKAGSGATYKSITKEDGKAKDVVDVATGKTEYFIPAYKVKYDGVTDELTIYAYEGDTKIAGKLYIVVSEKAKTSLSESDLKKNTKTIETAANGVKVGLSTDLGFATGKDAFVYVVMSPSDPSEKITKPADYLVAQIAKNPEDVSSIVINYYMMDSDKEDASGIIVANKKTSSGEEAIAEANLLYKTDAETSVWAPAKYIEDEQDGFTPKALYTAVGYVAGKKAPKLFVRAKGVSVTDEKTPTAFNALADAAKPLRPGKDKSVSLKLQAKAPNVKFDAKTGTIAVQNGYDYQLKDATLSQAQISALDFATWTTVRPFNANGTGDKTGSSYIPQDKIVLANSEVTPAIAGNQSSYTSTKVKNMDAVNAAPKFWIVRKSATTKAPASESAIIEVPAQKAAPTMAETSSAYAVVDHVAGKAVNLIAPEISNATGDTASAKYEYAIINKTDFATDNTKVIWSSVKWTSLKKDAKIKTTARSKYYTATDVTNSSTYGDKLSATDHKPIYTCDVYIVIRRCGESKDSAYIVPSALLQTEVTFAANKFTWKKYVAPADPAPGT